MEDTPLLTMTKSRIIDEVPHLSGESQSLLNTLSGLCSFHSSDDLASFLFTDMFRNLVGISEPWLSFEIGVYRDHTKTIELIPARDGITLADGAMTGAIENNVVTVKSQLECASVLTNWHNHTINE